MIVEGPEVGVASQCEAVLRTLPMWFGIEASLLEYARNTERFPTFVVRKGGAVTAFLTLQQHFPEAWEVHCIAVSADERRAGLGRALHAHAEHWLFARGARVLQVKTMAESCPSPEYAETRRFYSAIGYVPLEMFPELWGPRLPVLQLVKPLTSAGIVA